MNSLANTFDLPLRNMIDTTNFVLKQICDVNSVYEVIKFRLSVAIECDVDEAKKLLFYINLLRSAQTDKQKYQIFLNFLRQDEDLLAIEICMLFDFYTCGDKNIAEKLMEKIEDGDLNDGNYLTACNIARDLYKIRNKCNEMFKNK